MLDERPVCRLADFGMAGSRSDRSPIAAIVGYLIVGLIAYLLLQALIGTVFWLIRTFFVVVILGGLIALYLHLKLPDSD